jgi:hypothetical protein
MSTLVFSEIITGNAYIYLYPASNMVSISTNPTTPKKYKINGTYSFSIQTHNKHSSITAVINGPGVSKFCTIYNADEKDSLDYIILDLRRFSGNNMSMTFYSESNCTYSFFFGE